MLFRCWVVGWGGLTRYVWQRKSVFEHTWKRNGSQTTTKPVKRAKVTGAKLNHWDDIEQKVYELVESSTEKMLPGEIAAELGFNAIQVGKAVSISQRLDKRGAYVVLSQ